MDNITRSKFTQRGLLLVAEILVLGLFLETKTESCRNQPELWGIVVYVEPEFFNVIVVENEQYP